MKKIEPNVMTVKESLLWWVFCIIMISFQLLVTPNVLKHGVIDGIIITFKELLK